MQFNRWSSKTPRDLAPFSKLFSEFSCTLIMARLEGGRNNRWPVRIQPGEWKGRDCLATSSPPQPLSPISRVRAHVYTHEIRERGRRLKGEREGSRETVSGWHYIVGLAARGKLGGQSFDRLFGKHKDRVCVQTVWAPTYSLLAICQCPSSLSLRWKITLDNPRDWHPRRNREIARNWTGVEIFLEIAKNDEDED